MYLEHVGSVPNSCFQQTHCLYNRPLKYYHFHSSYKMLKPYSDIKVQNHLGTNQAPK